jgi:hypothetical protein
MKELVLVLILLLSSPVSASQPRAVSSTEIHSDARIGLTVVGGAVALPEDGRWQLDRVSDGGGLSEIFIEPPQELAARGEGDRVIRLSQRRVVEQARQQLNTIYWACREYAGQHEDRGPDRFDDLEAQQLQWIRNEEALENFALVPRVRLVQPDRFAGEDWERLVLAMELRPQVDDGQHWILWNDGLTERVRIDSQRLELHGLKLTLPAAQRGTRTRRSEETVDYRIFARRSEEVVSPVRLTVRDRFSDRVLEVEWVVGSAQPTGPELLRDWAGQRMARWRLLDDRGSATILGHWLRQAPALYGIELPSSHRPFERQTGNRTTMFNVLGGRAAIQETFQMQAIAGVEASSLKAAATERVDRIPGVRVEAHDYERLLGGLEGGHIALADLVPQDRLFAWFPQAAALGPLLDSGSEVLFGLSSELNGNCLNYDLSARYLARLGLSRDLMRAVLESGAVAEMAVVLPDLYLIDGTDLTIIARLGEPVLAAGALNLLGLGAATEITARTLPEGRAVYWVKRGDLLIVGSQRGELERVVDLEAWKGVGSLGRSAEFRYMLTQLSPRDTTRAFVYFSDPFIRRLTGPGLKIGQLRRLVARAQMEAMSAGAVLYQLDHDGARASVQRLVDLGYVPMIGGADPAGFELDEQGVIHSGEFGRVGRIRTLLDRPVELATSDEVRAYEAYRDNYERFWRQFFDPIAIRFDQFDSGRVELETFILPLIDSSIYAGMRRGIASAESGGPLHVPVLDPMPVAMLSANLAEETWIDLMHEWNDNEPFGRVLGGDSMLLELLGPGIHVALADGDPVLSTGSGDLAEIFGDANPQFGNGLMFIPVAVSLLTRPMSVLVELKDPAAAVRELARLASGASHAAPDWLGLSTSLYRVAGRNEWIHTLSLSGVMKLRFSLNVQGRYLVISNQHLTHRPRLLGEIEAPNNGTWLGLQPAAAVKLRPSLRTAGMEQQRETTLKGAAMLYPLLLSGVASVDEAARRHQALFGFAPVHGSGGVFTWQDEMVASSKFGRAGAEQQPAFECEESETGLMRGVKQLSVSLRFEQEGLRVRLERSRE